MNNQLLKLVGGGNIEATCHSRTPTWKVINWFMKDHTSLDSPLPRYRPRYMPEETCEAEGPVCFWLDDGDIRRSAHKRAFMRNNIPGARKGRLSSLDNKVINRKKLTEDTFRKRNFKNRIWYKSRRL